MLGGVAGIGRCLSSAGRVGRGLMALEPLTRLRRLCLALPGAHEAEAWGAPAFRVKNRLFAMYAAPDMHHGDGKGGSLGEGSEGTQAVMG